MILRALAALLLVVTSPALAETIRLMKEIDEVIDAHGGWPGAFQGGEAGPSAEV